MRDFKISSYLWDVIKIFTITFLITIKRFISWPFKNKKSITGQTAVVTGGGKGLGREICLKLAKEGCNVIVADIDMESARITVQKCRDLGVKSEEYKVDVSCISAIEAFRNKVLSDFGKVDILVNNAGILFGNTFINEKPENVIRMLEINLTSVILMTQAFLPVMIKNKNGHIVSICSMAAYVPSPGDVVYSTSKYGVRGFMDALGQDIYFQGLSESINCTTVFPYFISTNAAIGEHLRDVCRHSFLLDPELVATKAVEAIQYNTEAIMIPRAFETNFYLNFPRYFWKVYLKGTFYVDCERLKWKLPMQQSTR